MASFVSLLKLNAEILHSQNVEYKQQKKEFMTLKTPITILSAIDVMLVIEPLSSPALPARGPVQLTALWQEYTVCLCRKVLSTRSTPTHSHQLCLQDKHFGLHTNQVAAQLSVIIAPLPKKQFTHLIGTFMV